MVPTGTNFRFGPSRKPQRNHVQKYTPRPITTPSNQMFTSSCTQTIVWRTVYRRRSLCNQACCSQVAPDEKCSLAAWFHPVWTLPKLSFHKLRPGKAKFGRIFFVHAWGLWSANPHPGIKKNRSVLAGQPSKPRPDRLLLSLLALGGTCTLVVFHLCQRGMSLCVVTQTDTFFSDFHLLLVGVSVAVTDWQSGLVLTDYAR